MIIGIILFIIGLCVGSFINALEYRIEEEKTLSGRSFCPKCKHQLAWYDLVPVVSWLSLLGKCRYCKKKISIQYPVVELLTAITFVAVGTASGLAFKLNEFIVRGSGAPRELFVTIFGLILLLFVSFCLMLIALYDYKTSYILSKYVYLGILAAIIYLLTTYSGPVNIELIYYLKPFILSAAVPALLFGSIFLVSRGKWIGGGDIELAILMGLFLGWPNIVVAFYFAAIVGSIVGLGKIYIAKKAKLNSEIAFAPFLIAGTFFAFVFGQQIVEFYVKIFLGG